MIKYIKNFWKYKVMKYPYPPFELHSIISPKLFKDGESIEFSSEKVRTLIERSDLESKDKKALSQIMDLEKISRAEYEGTRYAYTFNKIKANPELYEVVTKSNVFEDKSFTVVCKKNHHKKYFDMIKDLCNGLIDCSHEFKHVYNAVREENGCEKYLGWWDYNNRSLFFLDEDMARKFADLVSIK